MMTGFGNAVRLTMMTSLVIQGLSAISGILLARVLGPEGKGAFAAAIVYPQLVAGLVAFGFAPYLARRSAAQGFAAISIALVTAEAFTLASMQSVVGVLLIWGVCLIGLPTSPEARELALWFGIIWIPLNQLGIMLIGIDQGCGDWHRYNLFRFLLYPTYFLLLTALWLADALTVPSALIALVLANAVTTFLRGAAALPVWRGLWVDMDSVRAAFTQALPFAAVSFSSLIVAQADVLIATTLLDNHEVGIYVVALTVAQLLNPVSRATGLVLFTHAARGSTEKQSNDLAMKFAHRLVYMTFLFCFGILIIGMLIQPLTLLAYGTAFQDAVPVAFNMLAGGFALTIGALIEEHLKGMGRPTAATWSLWLALAIYSVVGVALTQTLGAPGLALAFSIAQGVRLIVLLVAVNRIEPLRLQAAIQSIYSSIALGGVLCSKNRGSDKGCSDD